MAAAGSRLPRYNLAGCLATCLRFTHPAYIQVLNHAACRIRWFLGSPHPESDGSYAAKAPRCTATRHAYHAPTVYILHPRP